MSKVIRPFGELSREIIIQADASGLVRVNACRYEMAAVKGFRPQAVKIPMDAREMVLALIKVVQDYSTVIFASMGEGVINHGQTNKNDDSAGRSG